MRILLAIVCAMTLHAESAAGVKWTAPAGWTAEAQRPMRAATYTIAVAPGDSDKGECAVYFFGAGQGGSIEANIDRWKAQFKGPEAKVSKTIVHGLPVTRIDASGEYSGMGGPMAATKTVKAGYRLMGAIVEGPGGNLFVKFTGPVKTVNANAAKFEQLIASFVRQ